ncbi:hypothetical protein DL89DRAFT_269864 [Linderina pennispora]|uniref:Uncharacterized protein n=1 Tax=Linderina pennispora TaxID=61395 RepID=A0A1Y1VZY6_9FUNG|nr:uncharacterized protein DL89DRAFT_269864 [Linderina pennispora]ORX66813.1 hypothetical protein DL89DRAFT_269864 [Linderina pennispora]
MSADQDTEMADSDPVETVGGALASVLVEVLIGTPAGQSEHTEQMVQDRDASDLSEELAWPVGGAREPGQMLEISVEREGATPESVVEPVEPIEDVATHDATGPVPGGQDKSDLDPTSKDDGISELSPADAAANCAQIQEKRMDLVEEEHRPFDMLKEIVKHEDTGPGSAPTDQDVEIREAEEAAAESVSPSEAHVANGDMTDSSLSDCLTGDIDIDDSGAEAPLSLESICRLMPDPLTVCGDSFDHFPAHALVAPRTEKTHIQAIYEYEMDTFPVQKKYDAWASMHDSCRCMAKNELKQPQCRACIGRIAGKGCRFAMIRYVTKLTITMTDGRVISKVPEVRQPITPIELPSRTVVPGDNDTWTASAMKSLLRRELAIVRELSPHAMHSDLRGTIHASEADSAIHPLYACSPAPCILRKVPLGARQRCDHCAAPIFAFYTDVTQHSYKIERGVKSPIAPDDAQLGQFATKEGEKTMHYIERHTKRQFVRELEMMLRKVNRIAQYCDHLDTTQPSSYSSISLCANELPLEEPELRTDRSWMDEVLDRVDIDTEVIASLGDADFGSRLEYYARECEQPCTHLTPGAGPTWDSRMRSLLLPKYPLKGADDLTLREFARLWEEDNVVVVTGLADKIDATKWTPTALLKAIAMQPTTVHIMGTTRTTPIGDITLAEFLGNKPSAKIMADKSQSSTADDDEDPKMAKSREMLEDMYTAPDGKLNLMNRLPPQYKQPELLSEVHMRRGRDNLRYDIADTFDLLVDKRRGRQAKAKLAVVDETPAPPKRHDRSANDQPTKSAGPSPAVLCSFLSNSDDSPPDTDQIITPRTFMGDKQCAEFFEDYEDAQAIRVFQNTGDLVMRQTARDTISVRSKFLSPEHASYARNVRHEALPVMDILCDRGEASASEFISKSRKHHIAKGAAAARARTGSKKQTS